MLASALAAAARRRDVTTFRPVFVEPGALVEDPTVTVIDELHSQLEQLVRGRSPREEPPADAIERVLDGCEPCAFGAWVFYPWSRRLVHVLPEPLLRELRLDRNRYAITEDEQQRLSGLCIAVAGLSVGRAVVTTMAHEGIGGELRLADFDVLDLSNLNRVGGGLADVGVSKVVLAAREVAELDPYIRVVAVRGRRRRGHDRRVRRGRGRDRRRVRRPRDQGAPARGGARRAAAGGDGDEPPRDARRRALRPRARPRAVPRPARRCHLRRADRADDQAEGPVRDPDPRPRQPHRACRGVDDRGQGVGLDLAAAGVGRRARRRDGGQRGPADRAWAADRLRPLLRRPRRADRRRPPGAAAPAAGS